MSKILQAYLRFLTKIYLKRAKPKIVAVTGSVGKTSTKEAIFEVLKIKYQENIRKSEGNLNNETGVPLAILGFQKSPTKFWQWFGIILSAKIRAFFGKKYQILVLEMAADKPGDIVYLTSFIKPHVSCITNIGTAHLEKFKTLENIVQEKLGLLQTLGSDDWAVLNIDDENLKKASSGGRWGTITYALNQKAEIVAQNILTEIENFGPKTTFQVVEENQRYKAETANLGRAGNVYAALAAIAVAKIFDISKQDIIEGLKNVKSLKQRLNVLEGQNGSILIDDTYNANPFSMKEALDILRFLAPEKPKKIAVLGDMLEIGEITDKAHKLIGEYAHEVAGLVVAVGKEAQKYQADKYFENKQEAADYLFERVAKDDIILIKASRGIGLETIVEKLKK